MQENQDRVCCDEGKMSRKTEVVCPLWDLGDNVGISHSLRPALEQALATG